VPHLPEMPVLMHLNVEKILQMDRLSPQQMMELSQRITTMSDHDKNSHVWEFINDNKVTDLENALMDSLIAMMSSGATGEESRKTLKKKQKLVQEAKAEAKQQKSTRVRNWTDRTDLCNKFRQELLSMHINALPKQGDQPTSVQTLQPKQKRSLWGRTGNPYAVEELDQ